MGVQFCEPLKNKNCSLCENSFLRDISFEENGFPDFAYFCSIDNHYIGYPDEISKECCFTFIQKTNLD